MGTRTDSNLDRRVILALMGVMAVTNMYISRNSINIAIIRMVNTTYLDSLTDFANTSYHQAPCLANDSSKKPRDVLDGPLVLSQSQQTILLACYYWVRVLCLELAQNSRVMLRIKLEVDTLLSDLASK